ncbi:Uncharacterised protein [Leminorella grimontii]|nr:Uncharacterised protein [Leminorella grimontii]
MADVQFNDLGFAKLTGIVHLYHVAPIFRRVSF